MDLNFALNTHFPWYCFRDNNNNKDAEKTSLHVFVYASMLSYGAIAYLTSCGTSGFVIAKTRRVALWRQSP